MARLPSALKRKEQDWSKAQQLRQENLARLDRVALGHEVMAAGRKTEVARKAAPADAPVVLAAPVPAASAEVEPVELERLRSRLATTEGMHRADNERNRQALAEAQGREAELQRRMQMQQQPAAAISNEELRRYVTPQQLAEFGEAQCRLLVAAARTAAGEVTRTAVQAEVGGMRQELAEQRAAMQRSREAGFWSLVNGALPRWREVNADAQFLAWLGERDALAGRTRQALLDEARAALDAERVVAVFNAWMQSQMQAPSARDPMRRVIPNGKPAAAIRTDLPAQSTLPRAWIAEQNRLYSQGYYRRRPSEWTAVQETIDKAAREGRIR